MTQSVRVRAPGKVNLYLAVGAREPDGYHPLATVFQAVDVYEDVTATRSDRLELVLTGRGSDLPVDDTNLAIRAARLLAAHAGVEPRAHLAIHKRVPVAGGMAGGSADAAGTLVALDRLWGLRLPPVTLRQLAAQLGADVPFCLMGGTAMGTSRGDVLTPVLARGHYTWLVITQRSGLSTPRVFRAFDDAATRRHVPPPAVDARFLRALAEGDTMFVGMNARNDLAAPALSLHSGAQQVAEACAHLALPTIVSGSGPTIMVLCESDEAAHSLGAYIYEHTGAEDAFVAHGPVPGAHVVDET